MRRALPHRRSAFAASVLLAGLVSLALAACSSTPSPSGGTPSGPIGSSPGATGLTSTGPAPGGSGAIESLTAGPLGSGPFIVSETSAGLTDLTSYTATLTKSFGGTVDGTAQQWSSTITLSVGAGGTHLSVTTDGAGALEAPGELYEVGGVAYQVADGATCTAGMPETPGAVRAAAEPANELYAVVGGDPAGEEAVNGVNATKVTFDDRAIGFAGLVKATGALWSATSGGYLVRYSLETEGGPEFFGPGASGIQSWRYELTDVNQPVVIDPPAGCPAGKVAADVMPGANDVVDAPGLLMYSIAGSIPDAIAFYQSKAEGKGWTVLRDPLMNDEIGVLELSSAEGLVTVLVTVGDPGKVVVHVALDQGQ